MIEPSGAENNSFFQIAKRAMLEGGHFSATTVAVLSTLIFFFSTSLYSALVYVQFDYFDIFKVATLFLGLFLVLIFVFQSWFFKSQLMFNWQNVLWSVLVFFWLLALLNSPSTQFFGYFRTFPLLDAELGFGWNNDSAFHVSIINSFNTFGFPSIAQNDTPFAVYHVLSHFVDSVLVRFSGVDAWDSYGIFYYFKSVLLLSSIVFFIASVCRGKKCYVFVLSLIFFTPMVVGTWHAVGSHGLWFTSLIVILSSPFVFRIVEKCKSLKFNEYFGLFSLLAIISIGKLSSGFSYSVLIGFSIFFASYKNYRVYVFGFSLILFLITYSSLMTGGEGELRFPEFEDLKSFILLNTNIFRDQLYQVYLLIFTIGIIACIFGSESAGRLFFGSVVSVLVLVIIVSILPEFYSIAVWYFVYGLSSVLLLLVYQYVVFLFSEKKALKFDGVANFDHPYIKVFLIISILSLTSQFNVTNFNVFNLNSESIKGISKQIYSQPFWNINRHDDLCSSIVKQVRRKDPSELTTCSRPLNRFNEELSQFMDESSITKKDTLLYIPKEIFLTNFTQFRGSSWARGMLAYAVTGVPLIHGIESLGSTYGYADYDESALWVERDSFDESEACKFEKNIIVVENFIDADFTLIDCQ